MYHSDCETYLNRSVPDSEACMFRKSWTCASYYNPTLKEASPKCVFQYKNTLEVEIFQNGDKFQTPIVSHQLDKIGQTIEYMVSNFDYDLKDKRFGTSIDINMAQRVTSEKDWIVSVLESNRIST